MKSNSARARILTNYAKMFITFFVGLMIVRLVIGVSDGTYAVIALCGTSVGLAGMLQEMMRGALVPELGLAFHSKSDFEQVYCTSYLLSFFGAVFGALVLLAIWSFLDVFTIPETLINEAGYLILSKIPQVVIGIYLAPAMNMLPVTNKMWQHNFWGTMERIAELTAVVVPLFLFGLNQPKEFLLAYTNFSVILTILVYLSWGFHGSLSYNKKFTYKNISIAKAKKILRTVGWNAFVVIAFNLYLRVDLFIVNILYGIQGTIIFSLSSILASYFRQLAAGLVQGVDAVTSRLVSQGTSNLERQLSNLKRINIIQCYLLVPTALLSTIYISDLLDMWVGDRITDDNQLAKTKVSFYIFLLGVVVRSLSEGWMKFLSGSGEVRKYGMLLLVGALCNPVLIYLLDFALPNHLKIYSVALSFSILAVIIHLWLLPKVFSSHIGESLASVMGIFAKPLFIGIIFYLFSLLLIFIMGENNKLAAFIIFSGYIAFMYFAIKRQYYGLNED